VKTVFRVDRGTLQKPSRTPQGFLRVDGWVGRPGIYEYANTVEDERDGLGKAGAIRRELRTDAAVYEAKALDGFRAAPITLGHPRDKVTAENVRTHEVGTVDGAARRDGDRVAATLVIKDAKAIKAVESGKQELSPGYFIDVEAKSGVDPKYGRFDAIQHNIVINHLALVERARGGSDMRLRMDGAEERNDGTPRLTSVAEGHQHLIDTDPAPGSYDANRTSWAVSESSDSSHDHAWIRNPDGSITLSENEGHTHTILDERSYAAPRGDSQIDRSGASRKDDTKMADDIKTEKQRADELEGEKKVLTARITELEGLVANNATAADSEALKKERMRADEASAQVQKLESAYEANVQKRAQLILEVRGVLGDKFRSDGLNERQLHEAAVKRMDGSADLKGLNDDELRGQYRALVGRYAANAESQARVGEIIGRGVNAARSDEKTEREKKQSEYYDNQWRKTIAAPKGA
jgi:hypothetical protein